MNYIELNCKITSENIQEISEILIAQLNEIGYESYDEIPEGVNAYILEKNFDFDNIKLLQVNEIPGCNITYNCVLIQAQNWNAVWEKNFNPIIIEDQCVIKAPFHTDTPKLKYEIIIEPKMSFGTGHHETTYLMLQTILDLDLNNKIVLDMGCGTGVLAILSSLRGAKEVVAIDNDEWAYTNTLENIEKNNCNNITAFQGDAELLKEQEFDIIIANINRNILLNDIKHYSKVLKPNGILLLSGIYDNDLEMINAEASQNKLEFINNIEKHSWVAAKYHKKK